MSYKNKPHENRTEEVLKNIFVIKVPLPGNPLKNTNSYFIRGTKRNLIIDTGFNMPECHKAMNEALDALNVDMHKTDIFLTHLHSDHTGLSGHIATEDSKVFISRKDKSYVVRFYENSYWEDIDQRYLKLGFTKEQLTSNRKNNPASIYMPKPFPLTEVNDGDVIDLGNYKLKLIETPGHTPGHMCLYIEELTILFSGDHILFDITPNIAMWHEDDHSLSDYIESLEKIKKLKITHTLSGHRNPLGDCHKRIDELIEHHAERLAEVIYIFKSMPKATVYEIASKMTWSIHAKDWDDFPMAQKWFAVSEAGSHLEYLRHKNILKREEVNGVFIYQLADQNN